MKEEIFRKEAVTTTLNALHQGHIYEKMTFERCHLSSQFLT